MNWNQIEGNWKQFKGLAKVRWGELTDSRMDVAAGKRDGKDGTVQEVLGDAEETRTEKRRDLRDIQ